MKIKTEELQHTYPITHMSISGELDANTYLPLIEETMMLYQSGMRRLILDMSEVEFMSSSGLVAIHSLALVMYGEHPEDSSEGWGVMKATALTLDPDSKQQLGLKLLNPSPRITKTLELAGFTQFIEVYSDLNAALASFH